MARVDREAILERTRQMYEGQHGEAISNDMMKDAFNLLKEKLFANDNQENENEEEEEEEEEEQEKNQ